MLARPIKKQIVRIILNRLKKRNSKLKQISHVLACNDLQLATCFKEWFKSPSCGSGNEKLGATSFCEKIWKYLRFTNRKWNSFWFLLLMFLLFESSFMWEYYIVLYKFNLVKWQDRRPVKSCQRTIRGPKPWLIGKISIRMN